MDDAIAQAARYQHRQITRAQLRAAGLGDDAIDHRARVGRLHPVFRGVYSLGGPPQDDRELWMAATLTYGNGARLSHTAAAELRSYLRYPLREIHVTTLTRRPSREGITAHHGPDGRRQFIDFIPVTGPEQTVLDCACTVRSDKAYRRIVRQAQVDDTTHLRLSAFAEKNRGRRGVSRLKRELQEGPSPTRSVNEDEVLEIFRRGGAPLVNHRFAPDLEADLYFPALGVVVEVDSPIHDGPAAQAGDERKDERYRALGLRPYRLR